MKLPILSSILALLTFCESPKNETEYPILGDLQMGRYSVGYKTIFTYDLTRYPVPYSDWSGKLYANSISGAGRQFQLNIWYPAVTGTGKAIKYDHYVDLIGKQTDFNGAIDSLGFDRYLIQTNELGGNGNYTKSDQDILLELDVSATLNAREIQEQFPVVVFPAGSSPVDQSIMGEFLASHGYLVVAFVPKGRYSLGLEVSTTGLEVGVDDFEFVLNKISEESQANMEKVVLVGNAIFSSVCAAVLARNPKIKAMVSLDGGFLSAFEQRLLNGSPFYKPENICAPILNIYALHPSIDPKYTFSLKNATRYYARFPDMSEFVFLNYGMLGDFIPDIIGEHPSPTKIGYAKASQLVLEFLNFQSGKTDAFAFSQFIEENKSVIDTAFVLQGLPVPPNIAELKNLFTESGMESIVKTYEDLKDAGNPQPFSQSFYTEYRDWLAWKKDPEYEFRRDLYQLGFDSYPQSSMINYYLGYFYLKTGDNGNTRKHYKLTLDLMDVDPDPTLTPSRKKTMRSYIQQDLASMVD